MVPYGFPRPQGAPQIWRKICFAFAAAALTLAVACSAPPSPPEDPATDAPSAAPQASQSPSSKAEPDSEPQVSAAQPAAPEQVVTQQEAVEPAAPEPEIRELKMEDFFVGDPTPPAPVPDAPRSWHKLARDGIHDPRSEALPYLQQPREALSVLPAGKAGNLVDWVSALRQGDIAPWSGLRRSAKMEILDRDIVLTDTKNMPTVTFPHLVHSEWLACSSCHDQLFVAQRGANDIRMRDILAGKSCGLCHGKVAFPADRCFQCHDGPRPGMKSSAS